jgi:uncharacterized delta-60 repeat protein
MRRCLSALLLATTIALALASAASAATGELDPGFADGGKLVVEFGGKTGSISDVAIQPDGKIVLAGWQFTTPPPNPAETVDADFVVKRVNADGTPDSDFGTGGTQVIPIPLNTQPSYNIANAVALQPDGKILVGGYSKKIGMTNQYTTIVRLQANGQLDTTFVRAGSIDGGPGMVVSGMGSVNDLELDSQGRIVLGGTLQPAVAPDAQAFVRRWLASGGDDAGFANPAFGWAAGRQDGIGGLALQTDQRIVLAGYTDTSTEFDAGVARVTTAGALDPDFSGDGLFSFGLGAGATDGSTAVAVQPDGKIDVAGFGTTSDDFTLTRLTSAGAPDNSLAGSSTVTADFGGEDSANAIALSANGKILLAGTGPTDIGFVRFQPGGTPDATFGPDGKRRFDFGAGTFATLSAVTLQSDGKIVAVGGLNDNSGVFKGTVVRLQGDTKDEGGAPGGPGGGKGKTYRCGGKRATIVGTNKKNRLRGTRRTDVIVGLGGNDTISGLGGNDIVCGGSGNDKLSGGAGKDKLYGDAGKDRLSGDAGNDRESGGAGNDKLLGGSGKDVLGGGSGKDALSGGPGNDKLNGNSGKDKLNGGGGKDGCAGKDRKASC